MKRKLIIRKLNAAILLLLFLYGTTPKQFLHDALADHKDEITVDKCASQTTVAKLPVYCHCDSIVVTSPFVSHASPVVMALPTVFISFQYHNNDAYRLHHYSHYPSRGPPIFAARFV